MSPLRLVRSTLLSLMLAAYVLTHNLADMADSDGEDVPTLPADTLAILKQFQEEQIEKLKKLESSVPNQDAEADDIEIDEDWVCLFMFTLVMLPIVST